jgi:RNA polymerase sigma factor (sigma-70 family)
MKESGNKSYNLVERQFIGFVMKTVQGLKLDYLRKQKKLSIEVPTGQLETHMNKMNGSCCCATEIFEKMSITETLTVLSDKQRVVVELVVIQDLTEKYAAEVLNISQQGVHQTKRRALATLERVLRGEYF